MVDTNLLKLASMAVAALADSKVVALRPPQYETEEVVATGVELDDGRTLVVCAPRSAAAGADLEAQHFLMQLLGQERADGKISFDVPEPVFISRSKRFGDVLIHSKVPGSVMTEDDCDREHLAISIGRALASFHELPDRKFVQAGIPQFSPKQLWLRHRSNVRSARASGRVAPNLIRRWTHELNRADLWNFESVPVHGACSPEAFVVAGDTVMAMQNFSRCQVADPAMDFAWFLASTGEDFFAALLGAYARARGIEDTQTLVDRAQLITELDLVVWLLGSIASGASEDAEEAEQMLTDLSREIGDEIDFEPSEVLMMPQRDFWNAETEALSAPLVSASAASNNSESDPDFEPGSPEGS